MVFSNVLLILMIVGGLFVPFPSSSHINAVRGYGDPNGVGEFHNGLDFLIEDGEAVNAPHPELHDYVVFCAEGGVQGDSADYLIMVNPYWTDSGFVYEHLDFRGDHGLMWPENPMAFYMDTIAPCVNDTVLGRHVHFTWGCWTDYRTNFAKLKNLERYFQYRFELETNDPLSSPLITEVSLNWDPLSIEDDENTTPTRMELLPIVPNPSSGFPVLRFSLPESGSVELSVFDLSGRMVQEVEENEYSAGYHVVQLENLSSGIYFCRMTAGELTAAQRFVVIE